MVITALTRNQVILHGTEGSNPSLSANKRHPKGCLFLLADRELSNPLFALAKKGSHLSQSRLGACSQAARRKIFANGEYPSLVGAFFVFGTMCSARANITLYKHSDLCYNIGRKRDAIMAETRLRKMSMDFSVDIINLVKHLKSNHETIM